MDAAAQQPSAQGRRPRVPGGRRARRIGLGLFFGSVVVNAGLGIAALLAGDFGRTEGKVLTSSLCVTGALLLVLLFEPAWERRRLRFVPPVGAATGVAGFALLIAALWLEPDSIVFARLIGTLLIFSAGAALASLLALATLPRRFRWVFTTALVLIAIGVAMLLPVIWGDWTNEWYLRVVGVVAIVLAAFTVTIPVLHRVSRGASEGVAGPPSSEGIAYCPFCGAGLVAATDAEAACGGCGRRFVVTESERRPD